MPDKDRQPRDIRAPLPSLKDLRFVFVVTYARSGSTLMQSLLNSVPGVQIRGENDNALYHLYRALDAVQSTRRSARKFISTEVDRPWYGAGEVRPNIFEKNLLNNFLQNVLVPSPGVRVTGFKEIRHNREFIPAGQFAPYMSFLLDSFPGSRIVFNSRRAADVASSAWLAKQDRDETLALIKSADTRFSSYSAKHTDRTIHMRYDDYVADHTLIYRMMEFLELEYAPEAIEAVFAKRLEHGHKKTAETGALRPSRPSGEDRADATSSAQTR